MSPGLVLSKPWAEARGACTAAIRYTCPACPSSIFKQDFSTSGQKSRGEDSLQSKPYTKDYQVNRPNRGKRRIFSLIQPTGIPHLGNYLGALRSWKDFQDERDAPGRSRRNNTLIYGIADLHSLTSKQSPAERREHIYQTFASLLAIGLDPTKCQLVLQSDTPAHSELMWILSNVASTGYLSRMTQWKEKIGLENPQSSSGSLENLDDKSREKLKLSLFSYPVLQAADILLYQPDAVPVGEDQAQHVEFTRQLARSFNSTYCREGEPPVLKVPELILSPARRVMSLTDPTKKMSKSDADPMSRILITDSPDEIRLKFKKAKTDSIPGPITYSHVERPGISNLIDIYKHTQRNPKNQDTVAAECRDMTLGALKAAVADAVVQELDGIRDRYLTLIENGNQTVDKAILSGRGISHARAGKTMFAVRKAVGLYSVDLRISRSGKMSIEETEDEPDDQGSQDTEGVDHKAKTS